MANSRDKGASFERKICSLIKLATDGQVKANDFMKEAQERMVGR